jgi:hypothetical protein
MAAERPRHLTRLNPRLNSELADRLRRDADAGITEHQSRDDDHKLRQRHDRQPPDLNQPRANRRRPRTPRRAARSSITASRIRAVSTDIGRAGFSHTCRVSRCAPSCQLRQSPHPPTCAFTSARPGTDCSSSSQADNASRAI